MDAVATSPPGVGARESRLVSRQSMIMGSKDLGF